MKKYLSIFLILHFYSFGQQFEEQQELIALYKLGNSNSVLNKIAQNLNYLNLLDSSFHTSKKVLEVAVNKEDIATASLNIAIILQKKGRYFEANTYYEKAIKSAPNDSLLGISYHFLGTCYKDQSLLDKTLETQQKALEIARKRGLKDLQIRCLNTIGLTALRQDNYYGKSLKLFQDAFKIVNEIDDDLMKSVLLKNIGWVHLLWHEEKQGLAHINKAIDLQKSSNKARVQQNLFYSYIVLVQYYNTVKKDYIRSDEYALKALELAEKANWIEESSGVYNYLYLNAKALGNTEKTIQYLEKYQAVLQKLNEDKLLTQKAILEEKLKIESLELENKRKGEQRNGLIIILLIVLIGGFSIYQLYRTIREQNHKIEEINHTLESKVEERTAELLQAYNEVKGAMLRGQTLERKRVAAELHDNLGSLLSAVGVSMEIVDESKLSEREQLIFSNVKKQIDEAYHEVRLLSHNLQPIELEKEGLYNTLELLAKKINLLGKVNLELDLEALTPQSQNVEFNLYSICLEAINNILKHAQATKASITFTKYAGQLVMTIVDNGVGIKGDATDGVGLQNIRSRAEQMGAQLKVSSKQGVGTVYEIMMGGK